MSHVERTRGLASDGHPAPASTWSKSAFGFGAVATGVTETGFNYFLLIFYAQVIGLDAWFVSLATTLALLVDAFADPIVGYWSDNTRSRWGRRHPFLYAAALPIAVLYALVWMPPAGLSGGALFAYLLAISIATRLCFTLYETPSSALLPELSYDYDQRSATQALRYFFGWAGGNVLTVLMFVAVFPAFVTAAIPNGQFSREAYRTYGLIASAVVLFSVLACALGTHARIPRMQPPPPRRRLTLRQIIAEMRETLSDRSFGALFGAAMLGAIATGLSASLTFYFSTYFWGLTSQQIGIITLGVFASALIGAAMSPVISRIFGKKRGAMAVGLVAFLGAPLPIVLRLLDVLPGNDDPWIFRLVLATNTLDTALVICFQTLTAAMIADLVEQAELRTGRRSEGVFFAAITFVKKAVLGLGLVAASTVLMLAHFPEGAKAGQVSADTLWRLGAWYVPVVLALWLAMMAVLGTYRLGREDHETNLRLLADVRAAAPLATP